MMQDLLNLGRIMGIPDLEGPQLTELLRDVGRARRKVNATKHQKITIEDVNEGKLLKHPQYEHACAKLLRYLQVKFQGRALRRDNYSRDHQHRVAVSLPEPIIVDLNLTLSEYEEDVLHGEAREVETHKGAQVSII